MYFVLSVSLVVRNIWSQQALRNVNSKRPSKNLIGISYLEQSDKQKNSTNCDEIMRLPPRDGRDKISLMMKLCRVRAGCTADLREILLTLMR